ncbi:hypothetical protein M0812_22016 [Anaeramoeba flamelloides]|uniref:Glucosidase II subunit alpha n=1 Tax=Anaeramoeba flamelloides TaxID=1746091 RepID=A0AAV7YTF1_9EUKA|nr:hypothetical protein M0812_22016 [Anaeramoeba flamelloides]
MKKIICFFLFLFFLLLCCECADQSKFKLCSQSTFCENNREIRKNGSGPRFSFIPSSAKVDENKNLFQIDLLRSDEVESRLFVEISSVIPGVVRVKINEKDPDLNRYEVEGVLLTENFNYQNAEIVSQNEELILLRFGSEKEKHADVKLVYGSSWKIEILNSGGEPIMVLNNDSLFNFEMDKKDFLLNKQKEKEKEAEAKNSDNEKEKEKEKEEEEEEEEEKNQEDDQPNYEERFGGNTDSRPYGPSSVALDVIFPDTEHIYGLPEHSTKLSLEDTEEGEPFRLYNVDILEYETESRMSLYGSIPVIISKPNNQKTLHGIFWFNPSDTWIDISTQETQTKKKLFGKNSRVSKRAHWMSETGVIDLFIMTGQEGKMYQVFEMYDTLTGFPYFPPSFSVAYHQCRWSYKTQKEIQNLNEKFDEYDIPVDVFWMDIDHTDGKKYFTFDSRTYPDPKQLSKTVSDKGRKLVAIVDPHIKKENSWELYKEAQSNDYFIKKSDRKTDYEGHCWPGTSKWPDFLNQKVIEWWGSRFSYDKYEGSTSNMHIWNDMNEPAIFNGPEMSIPRDTIHLGEIEHRNIHNSYGFFVTKGTFEGLIKRNQDQNERPFILTRSFFAGSQRYSTIWTGDNMANWDQLKYTESMLLSLGLTGAPLSGEDAGGFLNNPDEELFARWFQTSAFHPFFRSHSHTDTKRREPWVFGDPYTSIIRESVKIRYSLLPFYYTQFYKASTKGKPIMRPLWLVFPEDANALNEEVENFSYMISSSMLVSPISEKNQISKDVYLPKGNWYDFHTLEKINSKGATYKIDAPLEKIPIFYRGGKIVPRKMRVRRSSHLMQNDPITLFVFLDENKRSSGSIFIDDGHSYDFKNSNKYIHQKISFQNNKLFTKTLNSNYDPALIERILIFGLEQTPKNIMDNNNQDLIFNVDESIDMITIKKPNLSIGHDWQILIQ